MTENEISAIVVDACYHIHVRLGPGLLESVFARVQRLLSAKVEDTVDRMETAGGEGVMREAIREVDRAID